MIKSHLGHEMNVASAEAEIFREEKINTMAADIAPTGASVGMSLTRTTNWPMSSRAPFTGLTLIPACISNYTRYNVWDETTYPFLNLNGATVEV